MVCWLAVVVVVVIVVVVVVVVLFGCVPLVGLSLTISQCNCTVYYDRSLSLICFHYHI